MGTRSRIGVMHGDTVKSVYCHWDGYLAHNGAILQEHYNSARANNLVALGDLSSLRPNIGEKHAFSQFIVRSSELSDEENDRLEAEAKASYEAAQEAGYSTFYNRDRGETDTEFKVAHTFAEFLEQVDLCFAEYYYIMKDGVWYAGSVYDVEGLVKCGLVRLNEALAAQTEDVA